MKYKLIAIDIDGTLLTDRQKVSTANIQAVSQAIDAGIKIVLCSGRDYSGVIGNAQALGLTGGDEYMIYFGGNIIQNYNHEIIYQKTLTQEQTQKIANFLTDRQIKYDLIDNTGMHHTDYQKWLFKSSNDPDLGVVKFLLTIPEQKLSKTANDLHQKFDDNYFVVQTSDTELEVFPKDVNKGSALKYLANYLNIKMDQVMAIGDMDNDVPMLKLVGCSVAMGNATVEVKSICDEKTTDNNHDGVANAINKYVLELSTVE